MDTSVVAERLSDQLYTADTGLRDRLALLHFIVSV